MLVSGTHIMRGIPHPPMRPVSHLLSHHTPMPPPPSVPDTRHKGIPRALFKGGFVQGGWVGGWVGRGIGHGKIKHGSRPMKKQVPA